MSLYASTLIIPCRSFTSSALTLLSFSCPFCSRFYFYNREFPSSSLRTSLRLREAHLYYCVMFSSVSSSFVSFAMPLPLCVRTSLHAYQPLSVCAYISIFRICVLSSYLLLLASPNAFFSVCAHLP